jgi:pimeloyl-ACP methyl ester carboxylesterase
LGIEKAYVVGASEGGFIGTNFALYTPERVEKLALLGPMGYSGAFQSVLPLPGFSHSNRSRAAHSVGRSAIVPN